MACRFLSEELRLRQVLISLHYECMSLDHQDADHQNEKRSLLRPLSMLRGIEELIFDECADFDPSFTLQLKANMQRTIPVGPLMSMSEALDDYLMNFPHKMDLFETALSTMYEGNMEAFKRARRKIVKLGDLHGGIDKSHLYDHDPKDGSRH